MKCFYCNAEVRWNNDYDTEDTYPESSHINPSALVSTGLSAIPGAIMGGPRGAALSAALGYLAHTAGHGLGRQAATDHMLGPGYNANTVNWHRLPGT